MVSPNEFKNVSSTCRAITDGWKSCTRTNLYSFRWTGCEYGDLLVGYCEKNIISNDTAFICFNHDSECCESCAEYIVSDQPGLLPL